MFRMKEHGKQALNVALFSQNGIVSIQGCENLYGVAFSHRPLPLLYSELHKHQLKLSSPS